VGRDFAPDRVAPLSKRETVFLFRSGVLFVVCLFCLFFFFFFFLFFIVFHIPPQSLRVDGPPSENPGSLSLAPIVVGIFPLRKAYFL